MPYIVKYADALMIWQASYLRVVSHARKERARHVYSPGLVMALGIDGQDVARFMEAAISK